LPSLEKLLAGELDLAEIKQLYINQRIRILFIGFCLVLAKKIGDDSSKSSRHGSKMKFLMSSPLVLRRGDE
jgi:hypothetical protein